MRRNAYIFVNGVLNYPGSPDHWTDRAVTWFNREEPSCAAEKFEYFALPLSRYILTDRRARNLATLLDCYKDERIILAAHSHGCEVARLAIMLASRPVQTVHFFAPAVPASRHGLGWMLIDCDIGDLHIHVATDDRVLSSRYLGGLSASEITGQFYSRHAHVSLHKFGHCGWWADNEFERTMKLIKEQT